MAQVVVGLDVGSYAIRVARLKVGFRTMELEKIVSRRLDQDPWAAAAHLAKAADLVFSALPGDAISIRNLKLPAAAAKRVEQILPFELDGEIPFDVQDMVIDHAVLGQTAEHLEVMAVAARRERVESHLAELAEVGVNPREIGAGALVHLDLVQLLAPTGTVVIVDVGHTHTDVCLAVDGNVSTARTSSVGGRDVTVALARAFDDVPEAVAAEWKHRERYLADWDLSSLDGEQRAAAEAVRAAADLLVREVRQTIAAHSLAGGGEVDKVLICGGGASLQGLPEYLSSALELPVELVSAPESMTGAAEHDVATGSKALSLALRGAALRKKRIDLRRGDLAFEGEAGGGRGLFLFAVAAVLSIMIAWGFSAYAKRVSLNSQREAQYQDLISSSERLLGERVDNFKRLETLTASDSGDKSTESPLPTGDAFDVVEQISKRIPIDINHEIDTLDIRAGRTQIQGRVDQRREADAIEAALSEWEDCFSKVQVTRTTPAVRDKRLQYTLDIETRCP